MGSNNKISGMVLRSGKMLLSKEEKRKKEFFDHFLSYYEGDDYEDIAYSIGLGDPNLYERVKVANLPKDDDDEDDEESFSLNEEKRRFLGERRNLERFFDLAEVRNKLRGYLVDSYLCSRIDEEQLNYIAEEFNNDVRDTSYGRTIGEYKLVCKEKLKRILSIALCKNVISFEQFDDITLRISKVRGKYNNTFGRNKEEYFGNDYGCDLEPCTDTETDVVSDVGTDVGTEIETETETEETIEETTEEKVETVHYESDSETETTETKIVTKTETNIYE